MDIRILPGLVTTSGSNYKEKIQEINYLQIKEISFFPTAINQEKRKGLYKLLEESSIQSIPHVHLRDDMELWELEYLEKKFDTKVFNIHNKLDVHPFLNFENNYPGYNIKTYIENNQNIPNEEELSKFAGLCIDFSHWEDGILLNWESYKNNSLDGLLEKFPVGCSHISAVGNTFKESRDAAFPEIIYKNYSNHFFKDLDEFAYLKKYLDHLPNLISLELENSFKEQLEVKEYLEKMIYEK